MIYDKNVLRKSSEEILNDLSKLTDNREILTDNWQSSTPLFTVYCSRRPHCGAKEKGAHEGKVNIFFDRNVMVCFKPDEYTWSKKR